ncbi:hypothetical protein H9Q72_010199 [Fusarium xylarioides]|uniref:Uncharacterized protein n=1 Tax=Fusarium xylarioides TaxID=221167 RepID=A0A9P7HQB5_9HYPO|nr:hypothetical protein H9Q72_010199 [Fusarium xylarioides]KAG5825899.1 hypothetical protein H9Q74_004038 [Fusarium xylarioides]
MTVIVDFVAVIASPRKRCLEYPSFRQSLSSLRARLRDQIHLLLLHHPSRSQSNLSTPDTMAAIKSLMTRDEVVHQLAKRQNWAAKEPGVIVVFCIAGVVAIGLLSLFLYRKAIARKANKASTV